MNITKEILATWIDTEGKSWGSRFVERIGNKYRLVLNAAYSDSKIKYLSKKDAFNVAENMDLFETFFQLDY